MSDFQVWLITGCSSGIGRETVLVALAAGHKVIATARRADALRELEELGAYGLFLDVTSPAAELRKAVETAVAVYGRIDVLVNNAGQIMLGTLEEASEEEVNRIFQVNLFGPINLIRLILPHMRERRSGTIINFGSIAGTAGYAGVASYVGTKFALKGYTESLNAEVKHLGIRAIYLELGYFRTGVLKVRMLRASRTIPEYHSPGTAANNMETWIAEKTSTLPGDPRKAAEVIVRVCSGLDGRGIPEYLALGTDALMSAGAKIQYVAENIEKWEDVSRSTDF
ncbi:NAD(P)-binding protein [Neolentinus lepideus HHB14362 ss-1]|uniref:NAD(P)-binding protein n=1 Tax=Neolentinus lepideus HHB14362 ss-1 TaxID=1314782 RepID=A0A165RG76_9AGAM|nr:NAD(P)-binding protein [Neolentinus lepideus HHB14362 ss-1]